MARFADLVGEKFGRLTVLRKADSSAKNSRWECLCICGRVIVTRADVLSRGLTLSCGCLARERTSARSFSHGDTESAEYYTWEGLIQRCTNDNATSYENYGGRGIQVCERWRESYKAFLEDVGRRPSGKHSLDRYPDRDGNYEPGNVRWATSSQQGRNRRNNRMVNFGGKEMCLADAVEIAGMRYSLVHGRLRLGWSIDRALAAG